MKIKTIEHSRNHHEFIFYGNQANFEQYFLLSSDQHWDNPDCDLALLKRHLEEAKKLGALVFIFGDFFCAMQGKYDKRSDKSKLRPEHQTSKYLDSLVETAADWLMPYREQIALIGLGNHETAILKNHETNIIERLVERLNANKGDSKHTVYMGGYGGWITIKNRREQDDGNTRTLRIKYFHGHGGGGVVTKGVIQSQRQALIYPDADIVVSGHVHEEYVISYVREKIKANNKIELSKQYHVRTPTYKDEYKDGYSGWHVETGKPPKPLGAFWLKVNKHNVEKHRFKFSLFFAD